ncbi:GATOR complex protein wdr59 [Coemansia sp. RSA 1804]|nr:GATOR complex protein wdr59 [Coemansia sp. RSA 1804]
MGQQLRALTKPRSLDKLGYYTRMVRFGLEHRGSYLQPDDSAGGGGFAAAASAAAAAVRDEDAPRYYFRPNVGRTTPGFDGVSAAAAASAFFRAAQPYTRPEPSSQGSGGGGGVGNSAVVCRAPEDRTASLSLARQLVVAGPSAAWVCTHNAAAYAMAGAARLAAVWALVASLVDEQSGQLQPAAAASVGSPWSAHPPVLAWLAAVLRRLERRGDAQTLALLACVLAPVLAVSADPSRAEPADLSGGGGIERAVDDQKPVLPPMLTPPIDPAADDSGEIERLMAEGMGSGVIGDASREPTPAASSPASPSAEAADGAAPGSASASAASAAAASDAPNDAADDADDGNIWRRLRSNVLGRVQPPPTKQPPAVAVAETAAAAAADASAAAASEAIAAAASSSDTPLPPAHQRPRRAAVAAPDAVVGPLATSSATRGVQASYSRSKRLFERRHTRVAMRRDPGGLASADLRLQTAYLDHWKLVYARVLYRWGMDAKAAEIVSCVADPSLRALLRDMYFQPSLAADDAAGIRPAPAGGLSAYPPTRSGRIRKHHHQLVCAWCAEFVRGRALVCHACGHGGHKDHMLRWFRGARARLSRCGLAESSPPANALLDSDDDAAGRGLSLASLHEFSSGLALHHAFDSASSDSDEDGDAAAAVRAGMMPDGAPTCPAGCGCNCLFESQKLFQNVNNSTSPAPSQITGGRSPAIAALTTTGTPRTGHPIGATPLCPNPVSAQAARSSASRKLNRFLETGCGYPPVLPFTASTSAWVLIVCVYCTTTHTYFSACSASALLLLLLLRQRVFASTTVLHMCSALGAPTLSARSYSGQL